jgi:hypothetical protein
VKKTTKCDIFARRNVQMFKHWKLLGKILLTKWQAMMGYEICKMEKQSVSDWGVKNETPQPPATIYCLFY